MHYPVVMHSDDALIVNIQQTGFYRVNYDETNWHLIANVLETSPDSIHLMNRGQLVNDALSLARANHLSYEIALNQTEYLKGETQYVPRNSAISAFKYLEDMLQRDPCFADFKHYLIKQVEAIYWQLGFSPKDDDSYSNLIHRVLVVSKMCELEYGDCIQKAVEQFSNWMAGEEAHENYNMIDSSLRKTIYCTAVGKGDEKEWNFLWDQMIETNNANERKNIIVALGCSRHIWQLQV